MTKFVIPINKPDRGYKYMSLTQKRDILANFIGRRLCLNAYKVRKWMNKNKVYTLDEIMQRTKKGTKNLGKFLTEITNI